MAAPALVYVLAVAVWPLVQGFRYSVLRLQPAAAGLRAISSASTIISRCGDDPGRASLVINTFAFTFGAVALEFVLGLGVALLLWRDDLFNRVASGLLLIPVTVTPLVVGLVFKALLTPEYGLLGYYFADWACPVRAGCSPIPRPRLPTLIAIDAWEWTPLMALILLAGLKSLPTDILEAAEVDGATPLQRFRLIVLPLLLPAAFLALILRMMDAFRVFDIIFVTTSGGPADATNTLMIYGVKQGLEFFNIGAASAVANRDGRLHPVLWRRRSSRGPSRRSGRTGCLSRSASPAPVCRARRAPARRAGVFLAPVVWLFVDRLQARARHLRLAADVCCSRRRWAISRRVPLFPPCRA